MLSNNILIPGNLIIWHMILPVIPRLENNVISHPK